MMGPNTASYIQMGEKLGELAPGKFADIILFDGDPMEGYGTGCKRRWHQGRPDRRRQALIESDRWFSGAEPSIRPGLSIRPGRLLVTGITPGLSDAAQPAPRVPIRKHHGCRLQDDVARPGGCRWK